MARVAVEKNIAYDDIKNLYYVTMDYGKDDTGKRIKTTKTFENKKDAQTALKQFNADKIKGTLVIPFNQTVKEWLIYWIDDVKAIKCEETTLYGYRNIINNHLVPALGNYKLQGLNTTILNKYFKNKKVEGLSNNTIRKHYDLIKEALKQAVNEEKILRNPLDKIEPIKRNRNEMNFYSVDQLKMLFSLVENNRMEIVVKLAGMLGLRREEIAGLKWDNIDIENKLIFVAEARTQAGKKTVVKGTKNSSSHRTLYAPDEIINLLITIKNKQEEQKKLLGEAYKDEGYIVAWENGEPYRPNYISDLFKKIIDDNKLPPLRLHDLRHTFASIANELGTNLYDISKALGHSQVGTTSQIYTHMFDKTHKKAISKIADVISASED
ncbi:tyrosine-type recombinase/integrase [Ruminiclostridium herbifermentans]|uniref:Tyrosine-type recombinase/integrase n=1 Tax=Ruminiclostridium herbifermentans TaxID=2488810 RepID=A0A4U7JFX0_9FIRM|nr:tyrosine-type recombinase/integrase [Ruminiclostridium herbifermentans]QNU67668.1 tyrosine-type recombinase/integrase [Ruminiclostridium herbifermentans]